MEAVTTDKRLTSCPSTTTQASDAPPSLPYEFAVLDKTYFKYQKQRFLAGVQAIRDLRAPERLCQFVPLEKKQQIIARFRELAGKLAQKLVDIKHEAAQFRKLYDVEAKLRKDNSMDHTQFSGYASREVETIAGAWTRLFEEGSIGRMASILDVVGLAKEHWNHREACDIKQWAAETRKIFNDLHLLRKVRSKQVQEKGESYCCKKWP